MEEWIKRMWYMHTEYYLAMKKKEIKLFAVAWVDPMALEIVILSEVSQIEEDKYQIISLISSVQFSRSVVSNSLRPHEFQHARPPCPSPSPRVHSNSHP